MRSSITAFACAFPLALSLTAKVEAQSKELTPSISKLSPNVTAYCDKLKASTPAIPSRVASGYRLSRVSGSTFRCGYVQKLPDGSENIVWSEPFDLKN
jgi:hypothetical protein